MDTIESLTVQDATVPGLSYRVDIMPDTDSTPNDDDGITPTQRAAWHADQWQYVGVTVTPIVEGTDLEFAASSVWGYAYGTFTDTDEDDRVVGERELTVETLAKADPGPDLIADVRDQLAATLKPLVTALESVLAQLPASA